MVRRDHISAEKELCHQASPRSGQGETPGTDLE